MRNKINCVMGRREYFAFMIKKNAPIVDKDTQNHFSFSFTYTFFLNKCEMS